MPVTERNSDSNLVITVSGLGKRFNREWIFRNLDYTFQPANVYAVTGPNGSGKSTLLQVLWGQLPQSKGELKYSHDSKEIPVDEIYNHLTVATPYLDLIEEFTLSEHLRFHFKLRPSRNQMGEEEILDRLKLSACQRQTYSKFFFRNETTLEAWTCFFYPG